MVPRNAGCCVSVTTKQASWVQGRSLVLVVWGRGGGSRSGSRGASEGFGVVRAFWAPGVEEENCISIENDALSRNPHPGYLILAAHRAIFQFCRQQHNDHSCLQMGTPRTVRQRLLPAIPPCEKTGLASTYRSTSIFPTYKCVCSGDPLLNWLQHLLVPHELNKIFNMCSILYLCES